MNEHVNEIKRFFWTADPQMREHLDELRLHRQLTMVELSKLSSSLKAKTAVFGNGAVLGFIFKRPPKPETWKKVFTMENGKDVYRPLERTKKGREILQECAKLVLASYAILLKYTPWAEYMGTRVMHIGFTPERIYAVVPYPVESLSDRALEELQRDLPPPEGWQEWTLVEMQKHALESQEAERAAAAPPPEGMQ
jgi:hypothetical protein